MSSVRLAALAALVGCAALATTAAHAQVFRIVGPDGRVTFSDKPPSDGKATAAPTVTMSGGGSSVASLPVEVRTAATRFPVTLYTGPDCQPCLLARSFLTNRGVPYTEKTISTADDAQALQRLSGDSDLRRSLGRRGRERAVEHYDASRQLPRLLDSLTALAESSRR